MFWDWEDNLWDWEDSGVDHQEWSEYLVMLALMDHPLSKPVILRVWARNYDDAMTCGEVLSGIYL